MVKSGKGFIIDYDGRTTPFYSESIKNSVHIYRFFIFPDAER
jgi:hypothetical protein